MYAEYENNVAEELSYEHAERTSDIQLPPVLNILLVTLWVTICLIGFAVMFLTKNPAAGAVIIGVPTFIGMVIKPTFALCIMMLVLPTATGVAYRQLFTLGRGVGIALAVSFALNYLITRPRLRIDNKALWVLIAFTFWVFLTVPTATNFAGEFVYALTQLQLLVFILIVYWILQTNTEGTFRWALRAYIIGTLGTMMLAFVTGIATRAVEEETEARYGATLGQAIGANHLAALTVMAFLAAIYLIVRDKNLFWRLIYLFAILFLPTMLLRMASRGALIALAFTLLSPFIFVRQILRRPALVMLILLVIILTSLSMSWLVRQGEVEAPVEKRLTDVSLIKRAIDYRMMPVKEAVSASTKWLTGTGFTGWFIQSGLPIIPHNDFFMTLGFYGIPGGCLFALFVIMMMFVVKRIPLSMEKLYARAVLTFLLVMGLNIAQLHLKYFWVFLAFVMASERVAKFFTGETTESIPYLEYEDNILQQPTYA